MAEILDRLKRTLQDSLEQVKQNAQTLREAAEEYSTIARLKLELRQLKKNKEKKLMILGENVFPYLLQGNYEGLKSHETLSVLLDEIKNLQNQIDLTQKAIERIENETLETIDPQDLKEQITELEKEIEQRLNDLKMVKQAIDEKEQKEN